MPRKRSSGALPFEALYSPQSLLVLQFMSGRSFFVFFRRLCAVQALPTSLRSRFRFRLRIVFWFIGSRFTIVSISLCLPFSTMVRYSIPSLLVFLCSLNLSPSVFLSVSVSPCRSFHSNDCCKTTTTTTKSTYTSTCMLFTPFSRAVSRCFGAVS